VQYILDGKKRESCKRIEISIPMEKNRESHFSKNRAALVTIEIHALIFDVCVSENKIKALFFCM